MRRSLIPALAGGIALIVLPGCGTTAPEPQPQARAEATRPGSGSLSRIYAALASTGTDYQPESSTLALARRSTLVAEGVATGVRPGRTIADPELGLPPRTTVLLEVAVDRTHCGPAQQRVLVELPGEGLTAGQFAAALPEKMRVVVYAKPAAKPDLGEKVVATSAEWRSVSQVWQPVNPQGLLFGSSSEVIAPLDDKRFPGVGLSAFRPSAKPYPAGQPVA